MKIKKVLAMCLISAMVLGSFAGCGKDEGESTVSVNQEDPAWKEAMTTPLWEISGNSELHPGEDGNEF